MWGWYLQHVQYVLKIPVHKIQICFTVCVAAVLCIYKCSRFVAFRGEADTPVWHASYAKAPLGYVANLALISHSLFPHYHERSALFSYCLLWNLSLEIYIYIWCDFDRASSLICGNKMPTRCNRGFYCRSYCLLNMFRESLCPSSGAQEYYTVVAACGILCCGFFK